MSKIGEIRNRFENRLADSEQWSEFFNNHEPDVADLLSLIAKYENAINEFVDKHFHGGSKANRSDYVGLGIPTADIYKLREAVRSESDA